MCIEISFIFPTSNEILDCECVASYYGFCVDEIFGGV
jgi:hypothetical protein